MFSPFSLFLYKHNSVFFNIPITTYSYTGRFLSYLVILQAYVNVLLFFFFFLSLSSYMLYVSSTFHSLNSTHILYLVFLSFPVWFLPIPATLYICTWCFPTFLSLSTDVLGAFFVIFELFNGGFVFSCRSPHLCLSILFFSCHSLHAHWVFSSFPVTLSHFPAGFFSSSAFIHM